MAILLLTIRSSRCESDMVPKSGLQADTIVMTILQKQPYSQTTCKNDENNNIKSKNKNNGDNK